MAKPTEWSESYWKGIREHGAKFIRVEPRMSEMGEKADLFLPVRPGTDAYLALAMCNVIITEGLQDQEFIDRYTYGYDEFKELVERYTPEEVENICWTPADRIREAARLYAGTKKALLCVGRGGNQTGGDRSDSGWLASRAILCLIGLTGNVGQKGNGFSTEASLQPLELPVLALALHHGGLCPLGPGHAARGARPPVPPRAAPGAAPSASSTASPTATACTCAATTPRPPRATPPRWTRPSRRSPWSWCSTAWPTGRARPTPTC